MSGEEGCVGHRDARRLMLRCHTTRDYNRVSIFQRCKLRQDPHEDSDDGDVTRAAGQNEDDADEVPYDPVDLSLQVTHSLIKHADDGMAEGLTFSLSRMRKPSTRS